MEPGRENGYVQLWIGTGKGYVREHRLVAEQMLGRPLTAQEEVHHINWVRGDNRPENLVVCADTKEHAAIEATLLTLVEPLIQAGMVVFDRDAKKYRLGR